jgi:pyridoxamine 5'-phosphate oxidase family protein
MKAVSFTPNQLEYIKSQHLARIGTASLRGYPDVAAVGFDFDGKYFYVGEHQGMNSLKFKNARENPVASLVIDDVLSLSPWKSRMLKIRGTVEIVERKGYIGTGKYLRITPEHKSSFGLD